MRKSRGEPSKNIFIAAAVVAIVAGGSFLFLQNKDQKKSAEGDVVVAEINGKPIYSSEADRQLLAMVRGKSEAEFVKLDDASKKVVLREIAAQKMILEEAYKDGLDKKKSVVDRVTAYRDSLLKEEFLSAMARSSVTEAKIKERYNHDVEKLKGRNQYKASHILLRTEKDAKAAKKALKKSSFAQVAKERSVDERTALTGGDLGYLVGGAMLPEFEKAMSAMSAGQVSAPVKTKFGWHIVKLEEKGPAVAAKYDQVKNVLARALYREAINSYVQSALKKAKIEVVATQSGNESLPANSESSVGGQDDAKGNSVDQQG